MHETIGYVGGRRFSKAFESLGRLEKHLKNSGDEYTEEFTVLDDLIGFCGHVEKNEDSLEVVEFSARVKIRLK